MPEAVYRPRSQSNGGDVMLGRLLRLSGTVLVIAVAFVTPVLAMAAATPASADTVVNGCTIVSNPTPTNFTNCPGADLSSANMSGVDLSFANLAGANLSFAYLNGATLVAANLSNANLVPFPFSGAGFQNANLSSANLSGVSTVGCAPIPPDAAVCFGTNFFGANLTDANLINASLATCQTVTTLFGSVTGCGGDDFSGADLTGANFTGATLGSGNVFSNTLLVPSNQIVNATSAAGAVVTWPTPQSLPGATPGSCSPPSGSTFVPGTTTDTCQILDDHGDAASSTFTVTVNPIQTTTSFSSSVPNYPSPSVIGHYVVYTAAVSPIPPGGTVAFTDNGSSIGGCSAVPVFADGTATCDTTPSTAGSHNIVATYSGYTNSTGVDFPGSTSPSSTEIVLSCHAFAGCNMSGLDLSGAELDFIDLTGANLSGDNLTNADLRGADLSGANLNKANLTNADLGGGVTITADTNFNKVTWSSTTCPDGTNSDNDGGTCVGHL